MEWIKVNDRLPEVMQYVLVSLENKFILMCIHGINGNFHIPLSKDKIPENNNITHWMHLPKPPKS